MFPVRWFAQGLLSVFTDDAGTGAGPQHGWTALVLGGWAVVGLVLCLTTFRWKGRRDG